MSFVGWLKFKNMGSLIAMAVFDSIENKRSSYTRETLECLAETIHRKTDRLYVIDNASCEETKKILNWYKKTGIIDTLITLPENIGTARAINKAWKYRNPGDNCVKLDNDVLIYSNDWIEQLEEAIKRDPQIGIVGLKRKDCEERPDSQNPWYKSELSFLPHTPGQSWIPFEEVQHVMGTCQMFSSSLLDKIGYLNQPGIYGFDDSLASFRARIAGFKVGFLPHIQIDHIDNFETPYWKVKQDLAGKDMDAYNKLCQEYLSGERSVYYED